MDIDITDSVTSCSYVRFLSSQQVSSRVKPPMVSLRIIASLDKQDVDVSQVNHLSVAIQLDEEDLRELMEDLQKAQEKLF